MKAGEETQTAILPPPSHPARPQITAPASNTDAGAVICHRNRAAPGGRGADQHQPADAGRMGKRNRLESEVWGFAEDQVVALAPSSVRSSAR
jgi:hypothetical protein